MALIAVMGANGVQGMAQMRQAKAAGHDLRAISRHRSDRLHALFPDAGFHTADLMDEASLVPALAGVDYLLVNLAVPMRQKSAEILAGIGRAALAAGVRRLVYNTATWIPERPGDPFVYGVNTRMVNALFRTGHRVRQRAVHGQSPDQLGQAPHRQREPLPLSAQPGDAGELDQPR